MMDQVPFSSKSKESRRSIFLGLVLCLCVTLMTSCTKSDSPSGVADELIYAFVTADVEGAKSVTVPGQWDRIEEWMEGREPFKCRQGSWDGTGIGGSCYRAAENEMNCGLVYQCASQSTPYCLLVNDILVRETEDGWKVYDWGSMCEAFDSSDVCSWLCGP
jgi:hypothetical protein